MKLHHPIIFFDTGIAYFGSKMEYVPYPFKPTHYFAIQTKMNDLFGSYDFIKIDHVFTEKEEWILDRELPGMVEPKEKSYTVHYPEAHYRRIK